MEHSPYLDRVRDLDTLLKLVRELEQRKGDDARPSRNSHRVTPYLCQSEDDLELPKAS